MFWCQSDTDVWVAWQRWLIWVLIHMSLYAISEGEKECIQTFIALVSAICNQNQSSFILLNGFLYDIWEWQSHAYVCLQLNSSLVQQQHATVEAMQTLELHLQIQNSVWFAVWPVVLNCIWYDYKVNNYRPIYHRSDIKIILSRTFIRKWLRKMDEVQMKCHNSKSTQLSLHFMYHMCLIHLQSDILSVSWSKNSTAESAASRVQYFLMPLNQLTICFLL
jgi:hypothetical protein